MQWISYQCRVLTSLALVGVLGSSAVCSLQAQTKLTTKTFAQGLHRPVWLGSPPHDYERVMIIEQHLGTVRLVKNGKLLPTPFLDLRAKVNSFGNERGLLGLAFHPDYDKNGLFFVNYSVVGSGATVIERYQVSSNPDVAKAGSGAVILTIPQPFSNHNGGCIQFGPDGYMYIGMGDGGSGGDPSCNAQNGKSLLGKFLRIDVNAATYKIPPKNPFVGNSNVRDEIWALGVRNPWRFSFDRKTGDMYFGDVGQSKWEEISFQSGSSKGGENFGWKIREGRHCYSSNSCPTSTPGCSSGKWIDPIHEYSTGPMSCSVTGGFVYRGCAIPDLKGAYIFGDYCGGTIWSFRYVNNKVTQLRDLTRELGGPFNRISSFGEDACGEIYICEFYGRRILKIVPSAPAPAVDLGYGKVGSNGAQPVFEACGILVTGGSALLRVYKAPAKVPGVIVLSLNKNPTRFNFGTVVPTVPLSIVGYVTDDRGQLKFSIPGGGGPVSIYAQNGFLDKGASWGVGLSNALQINVQK